MNAVGIHDIPAKKLGLRPPTPAAPRLMLGDFLTGIVPAHPATMHNLAAVPIGMYGNDLHGVCGPTSACNQRRQITLKLTGTMHAPSQEACYKLYRESGNPNFDPATGADDNGVVMQQMLQAMLENGLDGVKPLGFAGVDVANLDELDAAIAIFGSMLIGVNLQQAQQRQPDVWEYSPSRTWGGHAVLAGGYMVDGGHEVGTWGRLVKMTDRFIRAQESEAWVVIWPEHLSSKFFMEGIDLYAFASAFTALTNKPFPVPLPPRPTPPPAPPTPTGRKWQALVEVDEGAKTIRTI